MFERAHDERHSHHFKGTGNGKGDAAGIGFENNVYRKRIGGRGDGFAKASGYIDKTGDGDDDILTCGTASGMGTPRCNGK